MLQTETLRKRADFLRLRDSKPFHSPHITLRLRPASTKLADNTCRVGITVSKYCSKKAVERNRIKRRLRSLIREIWPDCAREGHDYVLIAKTSALHAPYEELRTQLMQSLKRAHGTQR